jgi:uncharacterized protein YdhG (YjbR/CyaY superfamily)
MAAMPTRTATTVDEYLAALPADKRAALQWLRRHIRATAPTAEECISYGIPAFRLDGKLLVHFGAAARHCAFYPGAVVESHKDDLAGYDTSKGTIRFPPETPLPAALIRKLVKAQIARRAARRQRPALDAARRVKSRRMPRPQDFRRIALGLKDAVEGAHMGHPDFRANGRIFATLHGDGLKGMVKLTPDQQQEFVQQYPAAFEPESGAWGRQGCTAVRLDSVDEDTLGAALTLARRNVESRPAGRTRPRRVPARVGGRKT